MAVKSTFGDEMRKSAACLSLTQLVIQLFRRLQQVFTLWGTQGRIPATQLPFSPLCDKDWFNMVPAAVRPLNIHRPAAQLGSAPDCRRSEVRIPTFPLGEAESHHDD